MRQKEVDSPIEAKEDKIRLWEALYDYILALLSEKIVGISEEGANVVQKASPIIKVNIEVYLFGQPFVTFLKSFLTASILEIVNTAAHFREGIGVGF